MSYAKALKCIEYDIAYVDHTVDVIVTLDAARERNDYTMIPGLESTEELGAMWNYYLAGTEAVEVIMSRAEQVEDGYDVA